MARELRIDIWCDLCFRDDEREPSVKTVLITVGNGRPAELDLCAEHLVPVQAALDMVAELGHPPDQRPAVEPSRPVRRRSEKGTTIHSAPDDPSTKQFVDLRCKICPHVGSTGNAMWQHARQVHQMTRAAYREAAVLPGSALSGEGLQELLTG